LWGFAAIGVGGLGVVLSGGGGGGGGGGEAREGGGGGGFWHKAAVGTVSVPEILGNPTFPWLLELIRVVAQQILALFCCPRKACHWRRTRFPQYFFFLPLFSSGCFKKLEHAPLFSSFVIPYVFMVLILFHIN